jgi:hypothetical protein
MERSLTKLLLAVAAAIGLIAAALITVTLPATASASAAAHHDAPATDPPAATPPSWLGHCRTEYLPVTLPHGTQARMAGQLCTPRRSQPAGNRNTALLLAHGATYNSSYWDWPINPGRQSFVWAALAQGYTTFAVDRLGAGLSTHTVTGTLLASTAVTFDAQATALHQVVTALRGGQLGHRYLRIVLVAHSYGSAEADDEAATYGDVDALVLTGSGHATSTATTQLSQTGFGPAATLLPARFAGRDTGWITSTTLQVRRDLLYNTVTPEPVVVFDNQHRDVASATEFATRPPDLTGLTSRITAPVELLDGAKDSHYCLGVTGQTLGLDDCSTPAALYRSERGNYQACFAADVVPGSGHDLATEAQAPIAAATALAWIARTVPHGAPARCAVTGPFTP